MRKRLLDQRVFRLGDGLSFRLPEEFQHLSNVAPGGKLAVTRNHKGELRYAPAIDSGRLVKVRRWRRTLIVTVLRDDVRAIGFTAGEMVACSIAEDGALVIRRG